MPLRLLLVVAFASVMTGCAQPKDQRSTTVHEDGGVDGASEARECDSAAQCNGGVCTENGRCCGSIAAVCGSSCCGDGTVCIYDKCVTPGRPCHTVSDCDAQQYCETSLGSGDGGRLDGGTSDGGVGPVCTQPAPLPGRCLDLPRVCDQTVDPSCVDQCEYRPPAGALHAVTRWTWDDRDAVTQPTKVDVWSTPTVGRLVDANCDGRVDELDPPSVVVVSNDVGGDSCAGSQQDPKENCHTGVLRVLDGRSGKEVWSLERAAPDSAGFIGNSVALGDIDHDGRLDIMVLTAEAYLVMVDGDGVVRRKSDLPLPITITSSFGWGGGLAIGDMDGDGAPEIAYGSTVFTSKDGKLTLAWSGVGAGSANGNRLSTFADVDGDADGHLELVVGRGVFKADGSTLWRRGDVPDGFPAVADFDGDGALEVVMIASGKIYMFDGKTGADKLPPMTLPSDGSGGPPTIADFDGDGLPEVGTAQRQVYVVVKPDFSPAAMAMSVMWTAPNHDLSSSVTGSTVFDFEGDGRAEVVYADECFLWVYSGLDGTVLYALPTNSFTATEAPVVADVDGDGRAEIVMGSNGANWSCNQLPWTNPDLAHNRPAWAPRPDGKAWRGVRVIGDAGNAWVGTRALWNQHTYHVTNICDGASNACDAADNRYGAIPRHEKPLGAPGFDHFRQNVQERGTFNAPDAVVTLHAGCGDPVELTVTIRNVGLAPLPAGAHANLFSVHENGDNMIGGVDTTKVLLPGQLETIKIAPDAARGERSFRAVVYEDPSTPRYHECRMDNNASAVADAFCLL